MPTKPRKTSPRSPKRRTPGGSGRGLKQQDRSVEYLHLIDVAFQAAANGIVITDRGGTIRWVNPAFTQITGYSHEEVVGRNPSVLKSGRQPASFYREMWDTILAKGVWHGEFLNRHKDGHTYIEEQTISPVLDRNGAITHFIGIKQDITLRKQYEQALENRNAELATLASIVGTISSSLEVENVLLAIVKVVPSLLAQAAGATIQMLGKDGLLTTRVATAGLALREKPMVFKPGWGVAGHAVSERKVINVGDVGGDTRFVSVEPEPSFLSLMAIPITSGDRILGVLSVEGKEKGAFLEHDERLLNLFAGYAAIAIQHANEYEGRAQAEDALKRYSEKLESMVDARTTELREAQVKLLDQQRLEQEIVLAGEVQASILPRQTPDLPGYEFAGVALAARYVSGDMYDWIDFSPEHCYLALADIAGKGIPAAMMASTARALLRFAASRKRRPGRALTTINNFLYDDLTRAGTLFTVVAADLDARTGIMDYASAGHTEVLWYQALTGRCCRLPATGLPIGVLQESTVEEKKIYLCPGDVLVFYSDGVTEAENEENVLFGTDRLVALVEANARRAASALAQDIVDAVDSFSRAKLRSDDLTIIVARALPRTVTFRYPGDFAHMEDGMKIIRTLVRAYGQDFAYQFELAASEIGSNIIEHAYRHGQGEVCGKLTLETEKVRLDIYDSGLSFDLPSLPKADPRQGHERGYGLHIVRQLMDEVGYSPAAGGGNHWWLVKNVREKKTNAGEE